MQENFHKTLADFLAGTFQARGSDGIKVMKGKKSTTKDIPPGKVIIQTWRRYKEFHRQAKTKFSTSKSGMQEMLRGLL